MPSVGPAPTPPPFQPANPEAQFLLNELQTLLLASILFAADGFPDVLCSAINPVALSNNTGINGTAVQDILCQAGAIQKIDPAAYPLVVTDNQAGLTFATAAIFAVNVAAGSGGINAATPGNLAILCGEVNELVLNSGFASFSPGTGTRVKNFVCRGANGTVT